MRQDVVRTSENFSIRLTARIADGLARIAARESNRRSAVARRLLAAAVARELGEDGGTVR